MSAGTALTGVMTGGGVAMGNVAGIIPGTSGGGNVAGVMIGNVGGGGVVPVVGGIGVTITSGAGSTAGISS
jgi:hypothetical protein